MYIYLFIYICICTYIYIYFYIQIYVLCMYTYKYVSSSRTAHCVVEPHGSANAVTKINVASSHKRRWAADKQALDSGPGATWQAGWSGLTNVKPLNLPFFRERHRVRRLRERHRVRGVEREALRRQRHRVRNAIVFDAFPTELQLEWPDYLLNDRDHFSSWQFWCLQNIATRPWDHLHAWCSFLNPLSCIMVCKYAPKSQGISRL